MSLHIGLDSAFGRPHYYWLYIGCILLYKKEGVITLWLSIGVVLLKRYILYSPRILLPLYYDDKQTKGNYAS
jgi:hypothetical protein